MINKINDLCKKYYSNIVDIRHKLHRNPEIGYAEFKTSKLAADTLTNICICRNCIGWKQSYSSS